MTDACDLLIVGGGPSGLATAIEARTAGLEVALVDRRRPPVDLACGEGLMPGGVQRLRGLGVEIPEESSRVFKGVRYHDGDLTAEARFRRGRGLGIRRPVLHRALVDRAEHLGVDLRWGVKATGLDDGVVATDTGELRARFVVAADGRLSMLRRRSGIETTTPARSRFGIRRHYAVPPWSDFVEVYWADEGEAYVTPVGPELVGIAMLAHTTPLDFDRLLGGFPELAGHLDGAPVATRDRGAGPFGQRPETVARGRLALVGDASGSLDPITGEGLSVAFNQARALVDAVREGSLDHYVADHRRIMRLPRLLTGLLMEAERRPRLRRGTIRVFAAAPSLFAWLVGLVAEGPASGDSGQNPPAN